MMTTYDCLNLVFRSSKKIDFDDTSKFIFLSDCHRGDNSWADDFSKNKPLFIAALQYYYHQGFTYIEVGDGDDLWENRWFSSITKAHREVFSLLKKFHSENRFYMVFGNHDIFKKCKRYVRKNLHGKADSLHSRGQPQFDQLEVHEGLLLSHRDRPESILVFHGHQGDLFNDHLWRFSKFMVKYVWRHLELMGIKNFLSPAKNFSRKKIVEGRIRRWIKTKQQLVITGHTHKAAFASPGNLPYFNTGSCIENNKITGIEIEDGSILLVQWSRSEGTGSKQEFERKVISGPEKLSSFGKQEV
ncbi:MAG: metallophosphoesterase family protein [Clostridia bacterium]|nr:metallophosphoesterase family protein [Clostridia bacterium]